MKTSKEAIKACLSQTSRNIFAGNANAYNTLYQAVCALENGRPSGPYINAITGNCCAGLSTNGHRRKRRQLKRDLASIGLSYDPR